MAEDNNLKVGMTRSSSSLRVAKATVAELVHQGEQSGRLVLLPRRGPCQFCPPRPGIDKRLRNCPVGLAAFWTGVGLAEAPVGFYLSLATL
jgi:hypothetical protein